MLKHIFINQLPLKKYCFLCFLILCCGWSAIGQNLEDLIQSATSNSIIYQSPARIALIANATVRFSDNAMVYLKWEGLANTTQYEVKYQTHGARTWSTVASTTTELTLRGLPLDQDFVWEVSIPGSPTAYVSDKGVFSTKPQTEPIRVSKPFYKKLSAWFSNSKGQVDFFNFLATAPVAVPEQVSFLQAYLYDNKAFQYPTNPLNLNAWLPGTPPVGKGDDSTSTAQECRCKVISDGSNIATPNAGIDENTGVVTPLKSQYIAYAPGDRTYVDRFEAGAAKFVSLRQDENSGGMNYQMSNMAQGAEDTTAVRTEASAIQFFLACLRTGGTSTNLPERCQCERPLTVKFQYSSRLHIKAEKKGCIFSKSTAAQAEDLAFVSAFNQGTGELTALDAGQFMAGRGCSSNWNPDFWIQVINLLNPVGQFFLQTLDTIPGNNIPTSQQLTQFLTGVQTLIGIPFSNRVGECGSLQDDRVLVDGSHIFTLRPNEPIIVTLFSAYYVRTRGYGCYRSEAGVASDYFLAGVVESELTENPECCTDKFSTYIAGSLSNPPEGDVQISAPNTIENDLQKVGFFLSSFGSWFGLPTGSSSGLILLKKQFDRIYGPSCELKTGERSTSNALTDVSDLDMEKVELYPTITDDLINIHIYTPKPHRLNVRIFNFQGQVLKNTYIGSIDKGDVNLGFEVNGYPAGTYLAQVTLGDKNYFYKFIVPQ